MRDPADPLGAMLSAAGALTADELAGLLDLQRQPLPLASLCYTLGLADEQSLVRILAEQLGVPGVVLDRSVIDLAVLEGTAAELALENQILPLAEDRHRLLVACERPAAVADVLRELQFIKGKTIAVHVALKITLERTTRACLRARARGQRSVAGPSAPTVETIGPHSIAVLPQRPRAAVIVDDADELGGTGEFEDLIHALSEDTIESGDALRGDPAGDGVVQAAEPGTRTEPSAAPVIGPDGAPGSIVGDTGSDRLPLVPTDLAAAQLARRAEANAIDVIDLDAREGEGYHPFHGRSGFVLVVDDDFASRQLLAKELGRQGYRVQTAEHGGEALARIVGEPPDAIVVDIMLPEIDGFHICRAVKQSRKYNRIAVVLISAVIDSGRVTDEVVKRHGADAYFEKPIDVAQLAARLHSFMAERGAGEPASGEESFERAMAFYRAGEIDLAVGELRRGIKVNPRSAKHHFVLANILHKKALILEAIDEYEATLQLKPNYFPALTRLAYLYYKQGYAVRAIETWRRSLPLCSDPALRHNIELFMRKLISGLG